MQADRALISGEGVRLELARAGVGSRTVAAALDAVIQGLALIVLLVVDVALIGSSDDAAIAAVVLAETLLVLAGYPIVTEWLTRGRTLGKAAMGLRVVRDDGGPIGFRQALVRGLAGLVLEKPGLLFPLSTLAGVFTIVVSESEKRIGDMMAGTIVLNERAGNQSLGVAPWYVPPALQPWAMSLDLHRLDDGLALRVRQFVSRAYTLTPAAQFTLGEDLRRRVVAVVAPPPPSDAPTSFVLAAVLVERRRRAEQPRPWTGPGSGAPPPPPQPQPQPPSPWSRPPEAGAETSSPFAPPR